MSDLERTIQAMVDAAVAKAIADLRRELAAAPAFLKAREYAARNSIALSTVREAIADGRLQPVKRLGRAVRIAEDATIAPRAKNDVQQARIQRMLAKHGGRR